MAEESLIEYMGHHNISPHTSTPELRALVDLIDPYDGSEEYLKMYLYWGFRKEYTVSYETYVGQKEKVAADAQTKSWRKDPRRSWLTFLHSSTLNHLSSIDAEIERTNSQLQRLDESLKIHRGYLEGIIGSIEDLPVEVPKTSTVSKEEVLRKASQTLKENFGLDISSEALFDVLK